jgi:hypothetical protein
MAHRKGYEYEHLMGKRYHKRNFNEPLRGGHCMYVEVDIYTSVKRGAAFYTHIGAIYASHGRV